MTSLYQLVADYRDAEAVLADMDADEQLVADTLEAMAGDVQVKARNVAMMALNFEATAAAIKEAEAKMAARRKAMEARAANLRRYIQGALESCGIERIESPEFVIAFRKNPASVEIFDERQIPAAYVRTPEPPPPAPDKKAIGAALKAGEDVPGARLRTSMRLDIR